MQFNQASGSNQQRQFQGQQRNYGQRTNQPYNYTTPSNSKELVVAPQKNYTHDEEWYNTCNACHYWLDCVHALEARKRDVLKGQQITTQGRVHHDQVQQQVNPDATLLNFTKDEAIIVEKFDQNQTWKPVSVGTRSKTEAENIQHKANKLKQQQVNADNTQPRPSNAQKMQYVLK